jgi:hypothetical protein
LNNIPINIEPFDEILKIRESEIKNSYNNILNKIQASKFKVLLMNNQLSILKVSQTNFFSINFISNDNVNKIEEKLLPKSLTISETSQKISKVEKEELIIARFYLENSINGNQTKNIYESIDKATFIDLQDNVFKTIVDETYEIEQDQLIKNIITSLNEMNEKINQGYKYEKDQYEEIIRKKIYQEFFTKDKLEEKINSFYKNGLINLDESSKNIINGYLDEILDNVKKHISNESTRLANELTSYSNNYKVFENTLTNIKNNIYNKFYSTILSVVIDFNGQLINKFYNNYIEKYFQDLEEEAEKEKFGQYDFLNTSLYLNKTMNQIIKSLINEYKNLTLTQIEYLKNLNSQQLDSLFSFLSIKNKINNEINTIYNSKLLPSLKTYAIYTSGDEGVKEYDFPTSISNNIDNLLNSKINQAQQIINKMKGKNYIINNEEWKIPDFSLVKKNEFNTIETKFKQFCDAYYTQDLKEIKNVVFKNVNNNFNLFIDSFIPSFGKDFYDRILKYNEIQKIKSLFGNLKYSLTITLIYYIGLCSLHTSKYFPKDLKEKILSLNNIESIVKSKNNKVISTLNSKIDQFFESNKNYLVEKYITQMKDDPYIISSFNQKIKQYIDDILDGKRNVF